LKNKPLEATLQTTYRHFICFTVWTTSAFGLVAACKDSPNSEVPIDTAAEHPNCVDDSVYVNEEACAVLCESKTTQAECEGTNLGRPVEDEANIFYGHACRWYHAKEVRIDEQGACVFGEERPICGYATWGDIQCGGNGLWCEGWDSWTYEEGGGYYIADGKTFVFRDICAAAGYGSLYQCSWMKPNDVLTGVAECNCACDMDGGVGM
jgi:hypothetical protein